MTRSMTVFLHVGQCGNQIAREFWASLPAPAPTPNPYLEVDGGGDGGDGAGSSSPASAHGSPGAVRLVRKDDALREARGQSRRRRAGGGGAVRRRVGVGPANPLFHVDGKARCVLVDSEPKVVAQTLRGKTAASGSSASPAAKKGRSSRAGLRAGAGVFRGLNIVCEQNGRGNNWAMGYNGPKGREGGEGSLTRRVLESLRREAERCDAFEGCFLWSSLSGGTGSGLGSRLVAEVRDAYPRRCLLTAALAPFSRGELPLQHYNSILASACHQRHADGVVLFRNDQIVDLLRATRAPDSGGEPGRLGFGDINRYVAGCLHGLVDPYHAGRGSARASAVARFTGSSGGARARGFSMRSWVGAVCPMPSAKLVEIWSTNGLPGGARSRLGRLCRDERWESAFGWLLRSAPAYDEAKRPALCVAAQARFQGASDAGAFSRALPGLSRVAQRALPSCRWNPFPFDLVRDRRRSPVAPTGRSVTASLNRTALASYLDRVHRKARAMFDAGAYMHWYEKYGCERGDMLEAFEIVQGVVDSYAALAEGSRRPLAALKAAANK